MKTAAGLYIVKIPVLAAVIMILLLPAYTQQFSDWSAPVNLGPLVNVGLNNQHPAISKDGLSLYYSSDAAGTSGLLDIWVSQRATVSDHWSAPLNLGPNVNTARNDYAPAFTPDGHWLYFHSDRPGGCANPINPVPTLDLYVSHRRDIHDDFAWEPAQNLGCVINTPFDDAGPAFLSDEDRGLTLLYFTSTRPGPAGCLCGGFDIYVSTLQADRTWGPGEFVQELSGSGRDTRIAISKDGLELFLSSDTPFGADAVGGQDLWVSNRASTALPWSTPVNLGPLVNSTAFDGAPALSRDGTTLYFFSERTDVQHFGKRDLYVTTRHKLSN
jgi:Tol biopolymer transport system component